MLNILRSAGSAFAAVAIVLLLADIASAQDRDMQEVAKYTLSEAGLAKYIQATKNIAALRTDPRGDCDSDDPDSVSLDDMVANYEAAPGVQAAIRSAGMTTREYVVFSWSIFQNAMAAWALDQPGGKLPAGTSKANVDFYNKHQAELAQLEALDKGDGCEEQEEEPNEA